MSMNPELARTLPKPTRRSLMAIVEHDLEAKLGDLLGPLAAAVPRSAWEISLLEPLRDFLGRGGKRFRAHFVRSCWALAGREDEPPELLPNLVEFIHAGSLIVDDIQDGSLVRRGDDALHVRYGIPLAINTGNWLYFFPSVLLRELGLAPERELTLHRAMSETMLRCHFGQALDLGVRCWEWDGDTLPVLADAIVQLKTASLFELSAMLAVEVAGADARRGLALRRFARELGVALQRFDDLGNLRAGRAGSGTTNQVDPKRHEDLRLNRVTWVWAQAARTPQLESLQAHARAVSEGRGDILALARALDRIVGAQSQILAREHLAGAVAQLREVVGDEQPGLATILSELSRLELSYG